MTTDRLIPRFAPSPLLLAIFAASTWSDVGAAEPTAVDTHSTQQQQLEQQQKQIEQLTNTLKAMQKKLEQLNAETDALAYQQEQQLNTANNSANPAAANPAGITYSNNPAYSATMGPATTNKATLWGYGEMYYTRPRDDSSLAAADLGRAVLGIGVRFSDTTRFGSEFEWEHAVTSSSDQGETEVEQLWVDHDINSSIGLQSGVFLIPAGYTNLSHEPTQYYGVQRNFVESLVIPSTWREGGAALHGVTQGGYNWNVGLTTGLNLSSWNFNPETPIYASASELLNSHTAPMQATHQEMQLASMRTPSGYLALNYNGKPGFNIGGTIFSGAIFNGQTVAARGVQNNQNVTLWEVHSRWMPGKWDLSTLYAHGSFSHTAEINALFPGATNPVPAEFLGYYGQAAYSLWQQGELRLAPFVRWERYDMGASYDGLAPGATAVPTTQVPGQPSWPQPNDRVWTVGASLYVTPNVVFKADYQHFGVNDAFNRIDVGMGLAF